MKAGAIMTQPAIVVDQDTPLDEVATTMLRRRIGSVLVVDHSAHIVGIVTRSAFGAKERGYPLPDSSAPPLAGRRTTSDSAEDDPREARTKTARHVMTLQPIVVAEDASVEEVIAKMLHLDLAHLPVVRNGGDRGSARPAQADVASTGEVERSPVFAAKRRD